MKTYAFIDSQNLNLGVRSQGWKLDWRKFRQYLRNKYGVVKAYLFIGQIAGNESLYTFLLVEYLESKKKLLKVLTPTKHYSSLLRKFNTQNYITRMDLLRSSLEQKKTGIRGRSKP